MPHGLHVGAAIRVVGLTNASQLNGVAGTCIQLEDTGRWLVKLITGSQKAIKPENLEVCARFKPGCPVRVGGLVGATGLNGCLGSCVEWKEDMGRWLVCLDNGDLKSIKPENLEDYRGPTHRGPTNADMRGKRSQQRRSRSRSPRNHHENVGAGTSMFTFGRCQGRQYEDVFMNEVNYCEWAMSCPSPRGGLLTFVAWLREQLMAGRSFGEPVRQR